ncbi:MAG TPA: hypothetical protein VMT76_01820 [Puia sp.]|nr:hypothetical protein [Puia sp.]
MPCYEKRILLLIMLVTTLFNICFGQSRIVAAPAVILCFCFCISSMLSYAQQHDIKRDSSAFYSMLPVPQQKDSFDTKFDSAFLRSKIPPQFFFNHKEDSVLLYGTKSRIVNDLKKAVSVSLDNKVSKAPFLKSNGGFISYRYDYRSTVDTPFIYNHLAQHNIIGNLGLTIANKIPVRINLFVRRSNSDYFKDITDVQVAFDPVAYRNLLSQNLRNKLMSEAENIKDTMSGQLGEIRHLQSVNLHNWLNNPLTKERLVNAQEILNIREKSFDPKKSDSANNTTADSAQKEARHFIELYEKTLVKYHKVTHEADSLLGKYKASLERYRQFQQLLKGQMPAGAAYNEWKKKLDTTASSQIPISSKDRFLLGVRNFGLGRSVLDYSELTVKNISINGFNLEYSSRYYFAVAAGLVDFRFRDFVIPATAQQTHQYVYLARVGIGRPDRSFVILTAYHGKKQLFFSANSTSQLSSILITGFSLETKWQLTQNIFATAEAAQSFSPNYQTIPVGEMPKWSLGDKTNKAYALKFASYFPATATRIDGMYRFIGANFQAFNSFQTNSQTTSWYVKAEQSVFNRKLKLSASLRTNDFSNPYILQNYKSNTVFKSLSATFRSKGLPVITVGYMPISQLTMVGSQLAESQFQTFNTSISHIYKIGQQRLSTSVVFTKFYNSNSDTGFIYYNSSNLYVMHSLLFNHFTAGLAISHSQNANYNYNVMEENFNLQFFKRSSIGFGIKINNLYTVETRLGGYVNASITVGRKDVIYLRLEDGYLPGNGNRLVLNAMGSISYTKSIR